MKIVYIASVLPFPPISGHRIRNFNLLKRLAEKNEIYLFLLLSEMPASEDINRLEIFCHSVRCYKQPVVGALDYPVQAIRFLFKGMPPDFRAYYNRELTAALKIFLSENEVDIIQIENPSMAQYIEVVPPEYEAKTVLTFHDINFRKFHRIAQLETRWQRKIRLWVHSKILEKWEPKYAEKFDLCVTMSDTDAKLLSASNANLVIETIPNGVDTKTLKFNPQMKPSHNLLFVGNMDYRPNIDAVNFFCADILPKLIKQIENIHFYIVGINPREEVYALESAQVTVTGKVDSVEEWYSKCGLSVVPLRAGGGTRLKILEAMACGCPVISTTIGAEGLEIENDKHLLIADESGNFASKILSTLHDDDLRLSLIYNGRERVVNEYDWNKIAVKLLDRYQCLIKKL